MKLVAISPEADEPREHAVLEELFAAGLERCHVRKPSWSREQLAAWLDAVPAENRERLILHQHHNLAVEFGCGGVHWKDSMDRVQPSDAPRFAQVPAGRPCLFSSRSCHTLSGLESAFGSFDSVFFSPVFPSISKPGRLPSRELEAVSARLFRRTPAERRTAAIALGGVTPENAARCAEFGFDGVAVLGALWWARDPLSVFLQLKDVVPTHAA